ncbi:MAG: sulfurtransferase-like selenium metabolism protein YedF [Thermodesulfobacteriota bacterium]
MSQQLDCRGMACPQPVLAAKEALDALPEGEIEVVVDNDAARSNVARFAHSQGCGVAIRSEDGLHHLRITKRGDVHQPTATAPAPEEYTCEPPASLGIIHVISSDTLGRGDDALGGVLMRAFIKTIKSAAPLPSRIYFYNTGVRLTATDSDLIAPLRELASMEVGIFSCGTCLDFLHLKESLLVGEVTNMFDILDAMNKATKVINPC